MRPRLAHTAGFAAALACAACTFGADYSGTAFVCGEGEGCPPGFECVDAVCVVPGSVPARVDRGNEQESPDLPEAPVPRETGRDAGPNEPVDDMPAPGSPVPGECGVDLSSVDGCACADPDTDLDGVPDCADGCPADAMKLAPGVCGCGHPDADSDGDGVPDCEDACPLDSAKTSAGACGCGVPEGQCEGGSGGQQPRGTLDLEFADGGEFVFPSQLGADAVIDAEVAPDGSIFATGYLSNGANADLLLMKLHRDGTLDTSFNGTGYITRHNVGGGGGGEAGYSICWAPDGDLLVAGGSSGALGYAVGFLWKVSPTGLVDQAFGIDGTFIVDAAADMTGVEALYDPATGGILAVGEQNRQILGFRILPDGSRLDATFGTDGRVSLGPGAIHPTLNVLADGTMLVAGLCQGGGVQREACSWQVDTSGSLVTSYTNFNEEALVHRALTGHDGEESWGAILPYPGNRLVLAGAGVSLTTSYDELVARVHATDGSFDTSFGGGDGYWTEDIFDQGLLGRVRDAVVTRDGSIVAALEVMTPDQDWDVALIRLDDNGVRDMSFADGAGILRLGGPYQERVPQLVEQPDGRLLLLTATHDASGSADLVIWAVND